MKRVIAPFLAILILLSSTGITYSTHFCMGRAVEHALNMGGHDLTCGMSGMDQDCRSDVMAIDISSCCDNDHIYVDIDESFKVVSSESQLNFKFLVAYSYTVLLPALNLEEPCRAFADNSPPPLEHDYQSMYQAFLL